MIFNWVMAGFSIVFNFILILLVSRVNVVAMGSYPILIYVSALMDVLIALSNAIVAPNIHMGLYSFVVFGQGTYDWPMLPGRISIYLFDLLFYQTFVILCYQFVYRLAVLRSSHPSSLLSRLNILHWVTIGVVFEIIFNGLMIFFVSHFEPIAARIFVVGHADWEPDGQLVTEMRQYYGIDMQKPFCHFHVVYAVANDRGRTLKWNIPILIYTLTILGLISALGVLMIVCATSVVGLIKSVSADCNIRASTHRQFFLALVIQTVVPLAFSFAPVACLVLLPLTGGRFGALGNYLMSVTSVYPAVDPLLLIFCVQSYRRKIYSFLESLPCKKFKIMAN
ncbi:hypothetical protein PRIPAC_80497, partial [Pristionchus pacificus]|uniref:G protein-coupled receptor n=1 Tax=Pristionchus pacificus TaxID=54126 RepID=A0A2A6C310_PRIPA